MNNEHSSYLNMRLKIPRDLVRAAVNSADFLFKRPWVPHGVMVCRAELFHPRHVKVMTGETKPALKFEALNPTGLRTLLLLPRMLSSHHEFHLLLSTPHLQEYHLLLPDLPRHGLSADRDVLSLYLQSLHFLRTWLLLMPSMERRISSEVILEDMQHST